MRIFVLKTAILAAIIGFMSVGSSYAQKLNNTINLGRNPIGTVIYNGATAGGEAYEIVGGGIDIWDDFDEMTYAYHVFAGDFDVQAQVVSLQPTARWSKAGLMVRETLAEDSRMVFMRVTPPNVPTGNGGNGINDVLMAYRTGNARVSGDNGGQHEDGIGLQPAYPNAWIRLTRVGSVFTGYGGTDGSTWTQVAQQDTATWTQGAFAGKVTLGLAVCRNSGPILTADCLFTNYTETSARFCAGAADSLGCPDRITVYFNRPVGAAAIDAAKYSVSGGVFINNAKAGPTPNTVVLFTDTLVEGASYTATVDGSVTDAGGAVIDAGCLSASFTHAKGFEQRLIHVNYNQISDATTGPILASQAYRMGLPTPTLDRPATEDGKAGFFEEGMPDSGSNERYSGRIVGVLAPAADGNYRFALAGDDNCRLYISTDDQPVKKTQIAFEPAWGTSRGYADCARRTCGLDGQPIENQSGPIALKGGGHYYIELIHAEGGGGNNASATWDAGTGTPFANGQNPMDTSQFIPSRFARGSIFYTLGAATILGGPTDVSAPVGSTANFTVRQDGTPPYAFFWQTNGVLVAGANSSTLSISNVQSSQNGMTVSVCVSNACGGACSTNATLTVLLQPILLSCSSRGNCHAFYLSYNKPMMLDGAYTVVCTNADPTLNSTSTVSGISYAENQSVIKVTVTPDLLPDTNTYCVTVNGVHSQEELLINPNPITCCFVHGQEFPPFRILDRKWDGTQHGNYVDVALSLPHVVNDPPDHVYTDQPGSPQRFAGFETPWLDLDYSYFDIGSGFWSVPATGNWSFWIAADDGSRLWLATDSIPCHKVAIANEFIWAGYRVWADNSTQGGGRGNPPSNGSAGNGYPNGIPLTQGQVVYLEIAHTEGTGGDQWGVTAVLNDTTVPPNGTPGTLTVDQFVPKRWAPNCGCGAQFFTRLCDVFFNSPPSDQTAFLGQTATFTAIADGTPCYAYQWLSNGVAIPGANGFTYTTPPARFVDEGTTYTLIVSNAFSQVQASANLHVPQNPIALSALTHNNPDHIYVTYNQPVVVNAANYSVDGAIVVHGAVQGASPSEVVISTDPLPPNSIHMLTIAGLVDLAALPIVTDPTNFTIIQGPGRFCTDFSAGLPAGTISSGTTPPYVGAEGALHLTDRVNGQANYWTIPLAGVQTFRSLKAQWRELLDGVGGGEGTSFNVGKDLGTAWAAEEGAADGLSVTVDTADGGGGEVGLEIRWNGARLSFLPIGGGNVNGPAALERNVFVDATVDVTASGFVTFKYDTFVTSVQIPNYSGIKANMYVFAGRTGGANETALIDDVCINDYALGPINVAITPQNPTVTECSPSLLTANVTGSPPYYYQWLSNGVAVVGAAGATYLPVLHCPQNTPVTFTCNVNNDFSSASATSTVTLLCSEKTVTAQPQSQSAPMRNGAVFSVAATAAGPLSYQWQTNGVNVPGATTTSLAISNLTLAASGLQVRAIVTDCAGSIASSAATLTVTPIAGVSFDFNTPSQYNNAPYNLVGNDWINNVLRNQQPFGPIDLFEVSTGGVGVATGGGGLDLTFNQGDDQTSTFLPLNYDFSLPGQVLQASVMIKLKVPTAVQRATQIGFVTATNGHPSLGNNVLTGLIGTSGQCLMSAIFQSTVVNSVTPSYQLRAQWKGAAGTALTDAIPINSPTNTLTTNRWYKFTAKFVNTTGASANSSTVESTLQDMGNDGLTAGSVVLRMTPQTATIPDIVSSNKFYFAIRGFENGGIDYYDQWYVTTLPGPIAFVAPVADQTVLQGRAASFQALVDGDGPYTYQWYKNGTAIPGAGNWKYATAPLLFPADNGAQFSVTVTSTNNSISSTGTVTVASDALGLLSAGSVEGSVIGLRFNQPVDRTSAETAANYSVNGTPAAAAQLLSLNGIQQYRTNGTELLLTPAAPVSGAFTVTVANVASLSGSFIGANNSATGLVAGLTGFDVDPISIGENGQVPTLPGYGYSFAPGQFTIIAGGHDIFGTFDGFRFTYKQVAGDFDVKVRVPYQDMVRSPQKAGFDVRVSLDPASPNVGAFADPFLPGRNFFEGTVRQLYNVASASWGNQTVCAYPNTWLRLRRVANTFMRYSSTNGVNWLFDGQVAPFPSFPDTIYLGLAANVNVGLGTAQQYNTAQFDSYGDFAGYPGAAIAISVQPADSAVAAGSATTLTVVATLTGSGVPASAGELAYRWQRTNTAAGGWTNMPTAGATNNSLSTGNLVATDQNAQYRVIVSAPGALSVASSVATVTVTDTVAPTVASSFAAPLSPSQLVLTFSELMDASTALNPSNYSVTNGAGVQVVVASVSFLNGDRRAVVITVANPLPGGTNFVGISGVTDLNGNAIAANTLRTLVQSAGATTASGPQLLGPVVIEFYTALPSFGGIGDLVNHQKYSRNGPVPNGSPDFYVYSNVFGIHPGTSPTAAFPSSGWGDNYGVRIYSYFKPAASGSYKFYSRIDDFGEFWLNTNANPALSTLPLDVVVGTSTNSPVTQQAWMCLDGVSSNYPNSKYLNSDINNSGFYVTPAAGNTVVGGMRFWSANDSPERDPMTFTIEGSANPVVAGYPPAGGPWTLIASGGTGLSTTRYFPGPDVVFTNTADGTYTNTTPYRSYRVIFPTVRNSPSAANSMQIGEVQFLGTNGAVVVPSGATLLIQTTANNGSYINTQSSSNLFLNAGQLYYMELRYKDTTGGDGGTVAVRSDAVVPGNGEVISNQFLVFPTNLAPATPIQFEAYSVLAQSQNANNGGIADLIVATNLTNFIARIPNMAGYTKVFGWNTNLLQGNATMDNYLGRIYAYFVAPSNGLYKFWMRSDDSSQILMNTNAVNSTDPAGAQVIGQLNAFTPFYTLVSQYVSLVGGQRYYLEARWREGAGGDGLCVMVKSQGDASTPGLAEVIPGSFFELASNETRFGPIKLAGIAPSNPTVNEGRTITFQAVGVSGQGSAQGAVAGQTVSASAGTTEAMPLLNLGLVWMKNGVNVLTSQVFAGQMYYVTPPLTMADNGSVITLLVSNSFSIATQSVVITVIPATPPLLVSAVASQYGDTVLVTFSEPVDSFTSQCLANYSLNGGLRLLSVKRDDVRRDRVSLVTTRQNPATVYTLTVNGVRALSDAGPMIAANSTINFSSWGTGGIGGVYVEIFTNMPGTIDEFLQFSPKYVYDMPDVSYYTNNFGVGQFGGDSGLNNYAARVSALFIPPSNGLYRFFVRGDDGTRLFMNTNGPDPAGRVLIARSDAANSASNLTVNPQQSGYQTGVGLNIVGASISPIISLTNGTGYWMEALMKEGFLGDYLEVLMRAIDSVTRREIGGLPLQPAAGNTINAANGQIGFFGLPGNPDLAGVVSAPPALITVHEDDLFTLALVLRGTAGSEQFSSAQWQRSNGSSGYTNIPGATGLSYSQYAALSDNGARFRVNYSMPGLSGTFGTLVIVLLDTVKPILLSAGSVDGNSVGVCLSERVNFTSGSAHSGAVDPSSYFINGSVHPTTVLPRPDGKSALLVLATPVTGAFTVRLVDFSDLAQARNVETDSGVITGTVLGLTPLEVGVQGTSGVGQYNLTAAGLPPYPQNPFSCTNGGLDVFANGWDIWNAADGFHFDYARPVSGDFDVRVRVQTLTGADQWSKAGLMARGSTASNSRFINIIAAPATTPIPAQNPVNYISFQWRDVDGASAAPGLDFIPGSPPVPYPNAWVRLQRAGNVFNGYSSADGVNWTLIGSRVTTGNSGGVFPSTLFLGLATVSHDQTRSLANNAYAEYRDLYLPAPPTITVQPSPATQTVPVHAMVSYSVTATNPPNSGTLAYQWLKDGAILPGATNPAFTIQDATVSDSGIYTVNAGNDGGAAVSVPVTLLVNNALPVVAPDTLRATQSLARAVSGSALLANDGDPEHDPLSLLAVSGIAPLTVGTNFDQGPLSGATLYGSAGIQASGGTGGSAFLALTPSVASTVGSMVINELTPGKRVSAFTATFNVRIGDASAEPADGLSFNFASDIPDAAIPPTKVPGDAANAEQGAGNGFSFCIDNYRFQPIAIGAPANFPGGGVVNTAGMKINYHNVIIAGVDMPVWNQPRWVPVSITVLENGSVTVMVDGTNVFGSLTLPGYAPSTGRFAIFARSGGQSETHWLDDLGITLRTADTPLGGSVALSGGTVTYTPPASQCGADSFYYIASDGQAGGQSLGRVDVAVVPPNPTPPVITFCPIDRSVDGCPLALPNLTTELVVTDACCCVVVRQSPVAGTVVGPGPTVVTLTASNVAGLIASCQAIVTVQDNQPPAITCPGNRTVNCALAGGASVTFSATATDTCPPSPAVNCLPPSGSFFPLGNTLVNCMAADDRGNQSSCNFTVRVNAAPGPSITCPANIVRSADLDRCDALVTFTITATDPCDASPTITCVPASGARFGIGTNTVNCTATDAGGLSTGCSFTVRVNDTQPPSIACPSDMVLRLDSGENSRAVNYANPTPADNCPSPTVNCSPASGSTFSSGATVVTCMAVDAGDNHASCSFTVTLLACAPPPSGLMSWWRGEGDASDSVGGRHGLLANGAAFGSGEIGQAFRFDGLDDYFAAPDTGLPSGNAARTVECWMKYETGASGNHEIFIYGGQSASSSFYAIVIGNRLYIGNWGGGETPGSTTAADGNWHHIALTHDGATARLYVDGQLDAQVNRTYATGLGGSFYLGAAVGSGDRFKGQVDEISLYNRALAANEVAAIYAAGLAGKCPAGQTIVGTPVVLVNGQYYPGNAATRTNSAQISLETGFPNGHLYFSQDGSDPNGGLLYLTPFTVTESATLRVVAYSADYAQSAEADPFRIEIVTPPTITQQPISRVVAAGSMVTFSVLADGTAPLSYQWSHNGIPVPDATGSMFVLESAQQSDAGAYAVVVRNPVGSAISADAILTVLTPPGFTAQPDSANVAVGASVTFCVSVSGAAPIRYQWRKNGVNISGKTNGCLTIDPVKVEDGGSYSVIIANPIGAITSADAGLTVIVPQVPPGDSFSARVMIAGASDSAAGTNFFATRETGEPYHAGKLGNNSVWYTWQAPASGIATFRTSGSTFDTLLGIYTGGVVNSLSVVASDDDSGGFSTSLVRFNVIGGTDYQIAIDGFAGAQGNFVLSWQLESIGQTLPDITTQPLSQTVARDDNVIFTVAATGPGLTYQWSLEGQPLLGETAQTLARNHVQDTDVGAYTVRISNNLGQSVESRPAFLEIGPVAGVQSQDKFEDLSGVPSPGAPFRARAASAASASFISVAAGTLQSQIFTTTNSTTQSRETNACGVIGGSSRWFALQTATNGTLVIDTMGSAFDTLLAVYSGGSLSTLTLLDCNNDAAPGVTWSRVSFAAISGKQYNLVVDGVNGSNGTVHLNWGLGVAPASAEPGPLKLLTRVGGTVEFNASATGTPSPSYQWLLNQTNLVGATNATLTLVNIQAYQAGAYAVVVSNFLGRLIEPVASLEVDASLRTMVESTFDRDGEGWGARNSAETPLFHSGGGNPSGYVAATNRYWAAPQKYLGNQSAVYGGVLEFDLKQSDTLNPQDQSDIILSGGGLTLVFKTGKNPGTNWTSYKVALNELAGWKKDSLNGPAPTQAEMLKGLAALENLSIRGQSSAIQRGGALDNVVLLAPPTNSAIILVAHRLDNQLAFEWPLSATGFQLQTATTLSSPNWTDVTSLPVAVNGLNTVSLLINPTDGQFYRLRKL